MARKRRQSDARAGELNLTAMIDIAFQMLSFFIITVRPMTVYAHLDVFRPAGQQPPPHEKEIPPKMIQIQIFQGALLMNGRSLDFESLSTVMEKLAAISKSQTIMILCARDSEHEQLIQVLDLCARTGMTSISVLTMN